MSARYFLSFLVLALIAFPSTVTSEQGDFKGHTISETEHERSGAFHITDSPPGASIYGIKDQSSLSYSEYCNCFVFTTEGYGLALPIGNISGWFSDTSNSRLHQNEVALATNNFGSAYQIEYYEGGRNGMYVSESENRAYPFTITEKGRLSKNFLDCSNPNSAKYCNINSIRLFGENNQSILDLDNKLSLYVNGSGPFVFYNVSSHAFSESHLLILQQGKIGLVNLAIGSIKYINSSEICSTLYSDLSKGFVGCSEGLYFVNESSMEIEYLFTPPGEISELAVNSNTGKIAFLLKNKEDSLYLYDLNSGLSASKKIMETKYLVLLLLKKRI